MKPRDQSEPDRLLDSALREWELKDPLPPRFREQVWRRIERAEAQAPAGLWPQFVNRITQALAQPSVALSYVTLLVLAGLLAGFLQGRVEKTHTLEQLSARYVQVLDPYQTHH